ncbi:hypothetical protein LC653_22060 [Nostoc sp. CHAB 5784]|uniref:hypothetical protein n=1 Tax=Nostoc mirabile TaxID=2907820 RepID=UPI001E3F46DB|nr:hypothetical protein [Nostoc mirabile]MCC5666522.1 hypothetical protein [Nostoc mirabile CHAB5784]
MPTVVTERLALSEAERSRSAVYAYALVKFGVYWGAMPLALALRSLIILPLIIDGLSSQAGCNHSDRRSRK